MEFKKVKLGEIGKIVGGGTPKTKEESYYGGKIAWITPKDLSLNKSKYIFYGERNITEEGLKNSSAKLLPKGTVLFSSRAPIGYVAIAGNDLATNQGFKSVIPAENVDSEFIYYLLINNVENIKNFGVGSTFREVSGSVMKNIEVMIPDFSIQRKIAKILNTLDSKIEINNKIISNLESQAQAIFKSWFVDFEPFQDGEFVESELGMIPEGWEVKELGEIINLYDNKRVPISKMDRDKMEKNYPYYGANGIIDYVDNYLFDGKYLLMGEDGTVRTEEGFPILNYVDEKFWVSNHAHIMRGTLVSTEYIYLLLSKMFINNIVTGAVQEKINQRNLKGIKIIFPEKKELERFEKIIEPMFKMKLYLNNQNTKLAELRDALLPKLMAGEIDVSNIKIEGEEVKNE